MAGKIDGRVAGLNNKGYPLRQIVVWKPDYHIVECGHKLPRVGPHNPRWRRCPECVGQTLVVKTVGNFIKKEELENQAMADKEEQNRNIFNTLKIKSDAENVDKWFWAISGDYKWFNLIIRVYGDAPFLKIFAINYSDKEMGEINFSEIKEIGDEIVYPDKGL